MANELKVTESPIPGLFVMELPIHGDSRGWFKENWQNEKMIELGLPSFKPVQNNISYNEKVGTTRGIHAEPWDKYVSVATGKVFGVWVDLREGKTFGTTFSIEIDPSIAVFVPRGVGNAFQTLEPNTSYVYLVNAHWSPSAKYTFLNISDESVNISWPIPLSDVEVSEKDQHHPKLKDVVPFKRKKTLIIGATGQLGKALQREFPEALAFGKSEFDISKSQTWNSIDWSDVETVINASAYTKVDLAETIDGRRKAWATNATGVGELSRLCAENEITILHVSSDYVFDGSKKSPYLESDELSPLGVYGQSKAAGDLLTSQTPKHYLVRTSWVIGEGQNFVKTLKSLAEKNSRPSVVNDQIGRLTFTTDLARFIKYLLTSRPIFGTYNFSSSGTPQSWFELACKIYAFVGADTNLVKPVSSDDYLNSRETVTAARPLNSVLNLDKTIALGFKPGDQELLLLDYLNTLDLS